MPVEDKYPYAYRAFGLNILSQFRVAGFEPAEFQNADVVIRNGEVPDELSGAVNKGVLFQASEKGFILKVDAVARYYAREGREILVRQKNGAGTEDVSAFLNGTIFGALLHQRRLLPLHASTVIYRGECLLFAGLSGAGKSTLTASLVLKGADLVADDISVIDFSDEKPTVRPAFPCIKLWKDSLDYLHLASGELNAVRDELQKYYYPVQQFCRHPVEISRVFILQSHNREDVQVKDLKGIDKFRVLKKHTYLFRGIPKTGLEQNHFMLVNKLANAIQVATLTRPNMQMNTEKMIATIGETINHHE